MYQGNERKRIRDFRSQKHAKCNYDVVHDIFLRVCCLLPAKPRLHFAISITLARGSVDKGIGEVRYVESISPLPLLMQGMPLRRLHNNIFSSPHPHNGSFLQRDHKSRAKGKYAIRN